MNDYDENIMAQIKRNRKTKILYGKEGHFMPQKVLIVEDSGLQFKFYCIVLDNYPKCQLFFAANRLETLNLFDLQKDIDLIISDINMPMM